jgi:hypothetical protein
VFLRHKPATIVTLQSRMVQVSTGR